jgi:hypothetical protein
LAHPDRRRLERTTISAKVSLERALAGWLRLRDAWQSIATAARSIENWERAALADAKFDECQYNISHIELEMQARENAP